MKMRLFSFSARRGGGVGALPLSVSDDSENTTDTPNNRRRANDNNKKKRSFGNDPYHARLQQVQEMRRQADRRQSCRREGKRFLWILLLFSVLTFIPWLMGKQANLRQAMVDNVEKRASLRNQREAVSSELD